MSVDTGTMSHDLTALVQAVPGVTKVYSSAPLVLSLLNRTTDLVLRKEPTIDVVAVTESAEGLRIAVSIAVDDRTSASEACRLVHDAIAGYLELENAGRLAEIAVRVGSVG
ncbi:hypothetical protein [Marisediminicola senii]|uniref:hypothetical protein n=1 Tax=Marisediminicola senii TaxID=2711233 RepID=UPI0013EC2DA4|nr:hypothetical protein [Marisediminicola senii]